MASANATSPSDDETRIRNALNYVLGKGVDREIGSIVLITDGADASFRAESVALGQSPPVIHSVVVGGDDPLDDQAIVSLHADTTAYVGVPAIIRADVRAVGDLRNAALRVQLWHESRLEQEVVAELDQEGRGHLDLRGDSPANRALALSTPDSGGLERRGAPEQRSRGASAGWQRAASRTAGRRATELGRSIPSRFPEARRLRRPGVVLHLAGCGRPDGRADR